MTYTLITTKTFCSNDSDPYRLHRTYEKNQHVAADITKRCFIIDISVKSR